MLEQLRRQSGSFIIWFIFAIIIAAFVLFFGPQASGELGCGASEDFIVNVDGNSMDIHDWRFSMNSQRAGVPVAQRQTLALDALVGRALLANAAREAGFKVSEDHVVENLKRGILYILGLRLSQQTVFESGVFDFEKLELIARNRGLPSVDYLIEQQREEILANMMRILLVQTPVSREEAEQAFIQQNTTVTAKYVKFDTAAYRNAMTLKEEDIRRYLDDHSGEIEKIYEARKSTYENVRPQVRVRHIMIAKPTGQIETDVEARAKEVEAKLAGSATFEDVAREYSDDERTKKRGGDLGWRPVDSIGFGKELSEAAKALEEGKVSGRIETKSAIHFLRIDGKREGKLSYDDVKLELAEDKARTFYAREAARRDAGLALAKLQKGEQLGDLFGAAAPGPGGMPMTPPNQPGGQLPPGAPAAPTQPKPTTPKKPAQPKPTTPAPKKPAQPKPTTPAPKKPAPKKPAQPKTDEPKKDEPGDKTGKVVRRTQTILASWGPVGQQAPAQAAGDQPGADTDSTDADSTDANATADAPTASGADEAAGDAEPPQPVELPEFEAPTPKVQTLGPTPRQGDILPGLGRAPELASALFEELEAGSTPAKVYEVGTGFVLAQLEGRTEADLSQFDGDQLTIGDDLEPCSFPLQMVAVTGKADTLPAKCLSLKKGIDNLQRFLFDECSKAAEAGRIRVNQQFLAAESQKFKYNPCGSLDFNAALAQVLSMSSGL